MERIRKNQRFNYQPEDFYYESLSDQNNSWCPIPWTQVSVHNSGEFRACIQARTCSKTKGILKDHDGNIMRADVNTIDEARNSPLLKDVRKTMLNGKRHSMCVRCNNEDDAGMNSRRRNAVRDYYKKYNYDIWKATVSTQLDGSISNNHPILEWDIRLGNLCNLKCRMCHPSESTQWYDEWFDTMFKGFKTDFTSVKLSKNINNKVKLDNDIYSWYDKSNFYKQFDTNSTHTKKIWFSGGEPTLVEHHYDMLDRLISSGIAQNMDLEYNINLTNIPHRAIDLWHKFKSVTLGCSIDGVGKVNNFIRYPSKWEKIEQNMNWLDKNTNSNINVFNTFTWQILNVTNVLDLVKYLIKQDFKKFNRTANSIFFSMHFLHGPDYLNVKSLPYELKKHVQNEFNKFENEWFRPWIDSLPENYKIKSSCYEFSNHDWNTSKVWDSNKEELFIKWKEKMESMMTFMWSEDLSDNFKTFVKIIDKQNKYRNQEVLFSKIYPEISTYIKKEVI